jgi:uncharacterized protein
MLRIQYLVLAALLAAGPLSGQTSTPATVVANGTGTVSAQPDQAQMTAGVVTQATTAQEAAQQNATQTTAVIDALKAKLGTNGTVQTISYSVTPRYSNGAPPSIVGYTATNTVLVTTIDLNLIGPLIDIANQAGANNVGGVTFGLQDSDPSMQQALGKAAKQALAHAGAIAAGLGGKTGAVVSAQESGTVVPYGPMAASAGAGTPTPIAAGAVTVSATVTVTVQLVQ